MQSKMLLGGKKSCVKFQMKYTGPKSPNFTDCEQSLTEFKKVTLIFMKEGGG